MQEELYFNIVGLSSFYAKSLLNIIVYTIYKYKLLKLYYLIFILHTKTGGVAHEKIL